MILPNSYQGGRLRYLSDKKREAVRIMWNAANVWMWSM